MLAYNEFRSESPDMMTVIASLITTSTIPTSLMCSDSANLRQGRCVVAGKVAAPSCEPACIVSGRI